MKQIDKYSANQIATSADNLHSALMDKEWDDARAMDFVLTFFKGAGSE